MPRTARQKLNEFDAGPWGRKYPAIAQSWRRNWSEFIPFLAFPEPVHRIIYTTNALKSLAKLRKAVRSRGHFPTDAAALKLLFLGLRQAAKKLKKPTREWSHHFATLDGLMLSSSAIARTLSPA